LSSVDSVNVYVPLDSSYLEFMEQDLDYPQPFGNERIDFVDSFSKALFKDPQAKKFPDLMSLAFWMRKSQVLSLQKTYEQQNVGKVKVPRGFFILTFKAAVKSTY